MVCTQKQLESAKRSREKLKSQGKKVWRSQKSRERRRILSKMYWEKMPEEERLRRRKISAKKAYDKNWQKYYQDNRRHLIARVQNRKVKKLGNGGVHTAEDIKQLWFLQHGKCTWCLQPLDERNAQVDHKIPIKLGGRNDKGNLQLLHERCNKSKADKHPLEYGRSHGLLVW